MRLKSYFERLYSVIFGLIFKKTYIPIAVS
jgi:hypothetical protein